jgi:hypothetical protein
MKLAPARGEYGHVSDIFAIPENIAGSNFLKVLSVLLPLCKYLMMIQYETLSSRLLVSVAWALSGKDVDGSYVGVFLWPKIILLKALFGNVHGLHAECTCLSKDIFIFD